MKIYYPTIFYRGEKYFIAVVPDYPDDSIVNVIEFDSEKYFHTIRYEAREAGLNLKELAELLGAPYRRVQDWNAGRRTPPAWFQKLIVKEIQAATE